MTTTAATKFIPRRGRPRADQVAAIERVILATAKAMFLENGYDGVAMEGVAAAAEISKGTLYARHASKEALFEAVIASTISDWSSTSATDDHLLTDDIKERLLHHGRTIGRALVNPETRAFQRLVLSNGDRFPKLARALHDLGYLFIVNLLARDIAEAATRDNVPVRDAENVAHHLVSVITGWHFQENSVREVSSQEIDTFACRAIEIIFAGRSGW